VKARPWALVVLLVLGLASPAAPQAEGEGVPVRVRADYLRYDRARQVVYARGNVVVESEELTLYADEAFLELETSEVDARGNVVLEAAGQRVTAAHLTYNFRTRQGSLDAAETRWRDPLVRDPVHLRSRRMDGNPEQRLCLSDAEVTTCDLDDPGAPYKLAAREVLYVPQDRIVMRDVSLYLFGAKVLTLPFFVLFLREPRQTRILPLVGYSEEEGFFVKVTTTYFLSEEHAGFVYTDWMERIGVGGGFEHRWTYGRGQGSYFAYLLQNRKVSGQDLRLRLQHRHDFGGGLAAGVFVDEFQRRAGDGTATRSAYWSLDGLYVDPVQSGNVFAAYSVSETQGAASSSLSVLSQYSRTFGTQLAARLQVPFTQNAGVGFTDLEAVPRLDLTYTGQGYSLQLVAEHRLDLDGEGYTGDNVFSVSRLPEMVYTGFPQPLRLGSVNLSLQVQGSVGRFVEFLPAAQGLESLDAGRLDTQVLLSGTHTFSPQTSASLQLSLRGSYYTTGDLRALVTGSLRVTQQLTRELVGGLTYSYKDSAGRTPFQFDRDPFRLNNVQSDLTYQSPTLTASLLSSHDFITAKPGPLTLRVQWLPAVGWTVTGAAQYALDVGQLTTAELQLRGRLSDQWEVVYSGRYTPATGQVSHDTIQLNYYQQCWAASATYRGAEQVVWLEAWLTAFPQSVGMIGLGQTGVQFPQPFLPSPTR
jgi:lipopolysaccharide assembly outer membrane protein LptD (OstA)